MADRKFNSLVILLISSTLIAAILFLVGFFLLKGDCEADGGIYVRTFPGYVCIDVEVIE